ncbi:E3 ubiquitin-protein ligase TRIM21-like [Polymixia lowei]
MASASSLQSEEQFLCSICLDVFTNPVSTPCGHNFCKTCITQLWDSNALCRCPNCNELFNTRPELQVNTFISEMAAQFRKSVSQTQLEKTLNLEMKLCDAELKRVQQYAVDVTLDPDTAHPDLILSEDGKQVYCGDVKKNLPDNPKRFSFCTNVLGKQSFSSGRFYFEVEVKGKTAWELGVARESIDNREIILSPRNGFWVIWLRNGNKYRAAADPDVLLSLRDKLQKVGVFVDYDEGLVSFYDVEASVHIYSYTGCTFSETLHPFFSPYVNHGGKNSAPLIISPVNHTD